MLLCTVCVAESYLSNGICYKCSPGTLSCSSYEYSTKCDKSYILVIRSTSAVCLDLKIVHEKLKYCIQCDYNYENC